MCISLRSYIQIPARLPPHIQVEKQMAQRLGRFRSYTSHPSKAYFSGPRQGNAYEALLLDAGGTLLQTVQPVEETYAIIGSKHGVKTSPGEIKKGFKKAFAEPWPERLRYQGNDPILQAKGKYHLGEDLGQGDGRPFWRHIVAQATGCASNDYFEELYKHFSQVDAWKLPVGAYEVLSHLQDAGVKLAVVSNFDTRLRPILEGMDVAKMFNAIIISSEVGFEKPAPQIFETALDQLNVAASKAVHVGDDQQADKIGAGALGIDSWLWGKEVHTFKEILHRILGSDVN